MAVDEGHSITGWLGDLRGRRPGGGAAALGALFRQAGRGREVQAQAAATIGADEDEEDAALSAFNSFCDGAARGKFPQLADRDDLWRLLVVITARKAMAQANRNARLKRGGGRVVSKSWSSAERRSGAAVPWAGSNRSPPEADARIRRDDG